MAECKLDHTLEDVKKKYDTQKELLPSHLSSALTDYLKTEPNQEQLNAVFHLLKKYDLVSADEREQRNGQLLQLIESK
ncbi:group-specific protein [Bacillus sp. V5-8f]|uniref:group-specific protein n=1 Tax=Bacillus sp. V5-8f TaxID=2053044 RepID=UPI000C78BDB1|nr:group-specific protein [Bacillus sp. V5-8f]PLT35630.1 group-specific protein [Bacillus sp. V5-8f]